MIRNVDDVQRIFLKYGPIPRFCIELAGNEDLEAFHKRRMDQAVESLGSPDSQWLPPVNPTEGISHRLFGVQTNERHSIGHPFVLTPYISGLIIQRAQAIDIGKAQAIFNPILGLSVTRTTAAPTFEMLVLRRLRCGAAIHIYSKDRLGRSAVLQMDNAPSGIGPLDYSFGTPEQLEELIEDHEGQLLVPLKSSFPPIDALLRCGETILLIQIALSKSHPVNFAGLDKVFKGIPAHYHPTAANKGKFVVITPSEDSSRSFTSANPVTTTKDIGEWEARLEKYVGAVSKGWLLEQG
jgi:hypothetical protein